MPLTTGCLPIQAALCLALGLLLIAQGARAQGVLQVSPLFGTAQVYDSNLFSTSSDPQADFITRVSPGVQSEYRSTVLTLLGRYTLDVERFAQHPELTSMNARQHATADLRYRPAERLTLAADAELSKTHTPGDLNQATSLTFTRASAQLVAGHVSITRQLDAVTAGTVDYRVTEYRVAGGPAIQTQAATVSTDRHLSSRDTVSASYKLQEFFFDTSSATSHVLGLGWTRAITRRASLSIDGGPRVTNGSLAPELSAAIHYQFKPGDVSLAYARTQTTVIGLAGPADAQSLAATAAWSLHRSLHITVSPAFVRSQHRLLQANVYRLTLDASHPIGRGLAAAFELAASTQNGNLYAVLNNETIQRQSIMIKLIAEPMARGTDHGRP